MDWPPPNVGASAGSDHYLAIAFRESPIPTTLTRAADGVILDTNQAYCRLLGRELHDVIGRTSTSLGLWGNPRQRELLLSRMPLERPFTLIDCPLYRADGTAVPCAISVYPTVIDGELCLVSTARDLSTEYAARKTADDSQRIIETALSSIREGVCVIRTDLSVAHFNEAFLQMHGLSDTGLILTNLSDLRSLFDLYTLDGHLIEPDNRPPARANRGESGEGEEYMSVQRVTGRVLHFSLSFSPIFAPGGEILGSVMIVRDIGLRLKREQQVLQHQANLEQLVSERTAELATATRAAEAANQAKTAFLANISHEIRTPLHAIATIAALLKNTNTVGADSGILNKLQTATEHLTGLIDSVLDLSRIEAGRLELDEKPFTVRQILTNVASITRDRAAERNLDLQFHCHLDSMPLFGDPKRLQQALLNYVSNAIKFTPEGRIEVRVSRLRQTEHRQLLRFDVCDTGIGIDPASLPRLFNPFEQGFVRGNDKQQGSGLGLAITRRLARLMEGDAGTRHEPGFSSTFWFTAWVRSVHGSPTETRETALSAPASIRHTNPSENPAPRLEGRVLLVEDDPLSRELLAMLLVRTGLMVDTASDGLQAIQQANNTDYQLILMDMQLPTLNGPEAAAAIITERGNKPPLPIIALTANAFEHDRQRCMDAGMCDFISKPISPTLLFARIGRWLGSSWVSA